MGLDMHAFAIPKDLVADGAADVEISDEINKSSETLEWWRKHHDLHGWMKNLYREKGGSAEEFNCVNVRLDEKDLDRLEQDVTDNDLPKTTGFFFGDNPPDEESVKKDLEFIQKARDAIKAGKAVFYDSWW